MGRVAADIQLALAPALAAAVWYDTERWPRFVDGCAEMLHVDGPWPEAGADLEWRSGPSGRGRVEEHVIDHVPDRAQTAEVSDDQLTGTQRIAFDPLEGGVAISL